MNANFSIETHEWKHFKQIVGEGNAGKCLRNFIRAYGGVDNKSNNREYYLRKELTLIEPQYKKFSERRTKLKVELEAIEETKRAEQLKVNIQAEKQAKIMSDMEYKQKQKEMRRAFIRK